MGEVNIVLGHTPSKLLAAILTFFIPGLGQMYKGQVLSGIFWLVIIGICYISGILLPLGVVLHIVCFLGAAFGKSATQRQNEKMLKKLQKKGVK